MSTAAMVTGEGGEEGRAGGDAEAARLDLARCLRAWRGECCTDMHRAGTADPATDEGEGRLRKRLGVLRNTELTSMGYQL